MFVHTGQIWVIFQNMEMLKIFGIMLQKKQLSLFFPEGNRIKDNDEFLNENVPR